jgi:hypothetical protein
MKQEERRGVGKWKVEVFKLNKEYHVTSSSNQKYSCHKQIIFASATQVN